MSDQSGASSGNGGGDRPAPILQVRDLVKHFPGGRSGLGLRSVRQWVRAVDGVSFEIAPGESLGLVGESGCGKSTIAKLLLRLEDPTSGQILFNDDDVGAMKGKDLLAYRRAVQAVFQDPFASLSPRMRVRDIIGESLEVHTNMTKAATAARVAEVLEMVGMAPEVGRLYPHEFSGGQRQRIAIAKALALDARMLVLDEAVSALDVSIRAQVITLLKDLQEQLGIAYLYIGHDLATVSYLADRVMVMYLGRVVELDETIALVDDPLHPYTQALFEAALPAHPDEDHRRDLDGQVVGEVPSALNPPSGCHFHTRCPKVMDTCSVDYPDTVITDEGRLVACHLHPGDRAQVV